MKLIFDEICEKMKLQKSNDWKIDYIISLIDDDGNGKIDFDEFMYNYRILHSELIKNPPLHEMEDNNYEKMCLKRDSHVVKFGSDIGSLSGIAKKFLKSKK